MKKQLIAFLFTLAMLFSQSSSAMLQADKQQITLLSLEKDIFGLIFTTASPYARTQLMQVSQAFRQIINDLNIKDIFPVNILAGMQLACFVF